MTLALLLLILIIVLVLSHEAGHFLLAKWRGVRVDEFGLGFPPRLFGIKKGETRYSINLLPLGGFVKIFGEDPSTDPPAGRAGLGASGEEDPRSFASQSLWVRSLIVAGGVLANLLAAWIIFSLLAGIGTPRVVDNGLGEGGDVTIVAVAVGSPADLAGLKVGDHVRGFEFIGAVQKFIDSHRGKEVALSIERKGEVLAMRAVPRAVPPEGEGALGIAMVEIVRVAVPWWQAPWEGFKTTGEVFFGTIGAFARMAWGLASGIPGAVGEIAGPVGIASIVSEVSQFGLLPFFQLMAVLSVNLAVINLLPIPALDGGRLLFFAIEGVLRKPVSSRVSHLAHTIGFAFLIVLMLVITYRDIVRLL